MVWFAKQSDGFQGWFVVENLGALVTGLLPGVFTVTIVDPADAATNTPAVAESVSKLGLYMFTIPSAFITANGVGEYGVVIEINKPAPPPPRIVDVISAVLKVSQEDFDSLAESLIAERTTAAVGSTVTEIRTPLTQADDFFNDMQVIVINAAGVAARTINDFANANGAITVTTLPFIPALNDPVIIVPRHAGATSPSVIADAVWDELGAGHLVADSFGDIIQNIEAWVSALRALL
jgi:hypothetical protein